MTKYNVGEKMPNLVFKTQDRDDLKLYDELEGKTIFWVLRYIGCTVCRYDVHVLSERYEEIKAKGGKLFVVMQSDRAHIVRDLENANVPFDIICDDEQKIYDALSIEPATSMEALLGDGLEKLKEKGAKAGALGFSHGDYEGNEQQLPALFIVGEDGTILTAHYATTIMDMPTVDEVLEML